MRNNFLERYSLPITDIEHKFRAIGQWVSTLHPEVRDIMHRLWEYYIRVYPFVVNQNIIDRYRSDAAIDPFRIIEVDPDTIEYMLSNSGMPAQARNHRVFPKSKFKYAGAVFDGDWDKTNWEFEETELFKSFHAHFKEGAEWKETMFFQTSVDHIQAGVMLWGCTSEKEFKSRCEDLDELYEGIKRHGYLTQKELMESSIDDPIKNKVSIPYYVRLVNDELTVCIGRNGEILFLDGRDRLAIAKLLGLERLPVWVLVRHDRWQQLREAVARDPGLVERLPSNIRSHPDLELIVH